MEKVYSNYWIKWTRSSGTVLQSAPGLAIGYWFRTLKFCKIIRIAQNEKNLQEDMSNKKTNMFVLKHMGYILSGIKEMISDVHSRGEQANLKASPLMLEFLKLQLRWVRRRLTSKRNLENSRKSSNRDGFHSQIVEDDQNYLQESKELMGILSNNVLSTLEILAFLLLRDSVEEYDSFDELQGWRLILDVIHAGSDFLRASLGHGQARHNTRGVRITSSTKQQPVSESALWLLRELILLGARRSKDLSGGGGIPWLVRLLREAWPRATLDLLQPKTSVMLKPGLHSSFGAGAYDNLSDEEVQEEDEENAAWAHTGTAAGTSSLRLALLQSISLLFSQADVSYENGGTVYHKDVTGSKVALLNVLIPTPGNLEGSHVPVGHCGHAKMLNAMGLGFCESGGVRFLLNLSLQGSNLDRSSRSVNQKRKAEAQYAFRALGACLDACEHNKKFIEDEIGFVELANLLNSSEIDLFEQEFDVILNLGMTTTENHLGRPYFNTKLSPNVGGVPLSLSLLSTIRRILFPEALWDQPLENELFVHRKLSVASIDVTDDKSGSDAIMEETTVSSSTSDRVD